VAPDPFTWTYRIPDSATFNCITDQDVPTGSENTYGFFMYRWTSKYEAENYDVSSDDLGDINPYYFLTELMTNTGDTPLASSRGACTIPKCGENGNECVLERIYIKYNTNAIQSVTHNGVWGQFLNTDNGIPSQYSYWAFNYTGDVANPGNCDTKDFSFDCNFWFKGGYPLGCQLKSDFLDTPVWYSLVGGCPKYPYDDSSTSPSKISPDTVWYNKLDRNNPAVAECWAEMPGGDYCDGGLKTPLDFDSKTCTWSAMKAGYLDVKDVLNIDNSFETYNSWCLSVKDTITNYGGGNGIPSDIPFFYNLSSEAFPEMADVSNLAWHQEASFDNNQIKNLAAKKVFQDFSKYAKIRLNEMFEAMDKQAFAQFSADGKKDPRGNPYQGCKSNSDITPPTCANGVVGKESELVV